MITGDLADRLDVDNVTRVIELLRRSGRVTGTKSGGGNLFGDPARVKRTGRN